MSDVGTQRRTPRHAQRVGAGFAILLVLSIGACSGDEGGPATGTGTSTTEAPTSLTAEDASVLSDALVSRNADALASAILADPGLDLTEAAELAVPPGSELVINHEQAEELAEGVVQVPMRLTTSDGVFTTTAVLVDDEGAWKLWDTSEPEPVGRRGQ